MKFLYTLLALCLLVLILPVSAGTAQLGWYNDTEGGGCVTAVDTNDDGTLIIAGYWNGNITAYNIVVNTSNNSAAATVAWRYRTNTSIAVTTNNTVKKIVADNGGNFAWITEKEAGYISSAGAVGSQKLFFQNCSDVALRPGSAYAVTALRSGAIPSNITIYTIGGTLYAQNSSFGTNANWTSIGFDPSGEWIVTSNQTHNRLYYWNVTAWTGWTQFNPTRTASKNASQQFIDSFPYREGITITDPVTGEASLTFINTGGVSYITQINNSHFYYNSANTGAYFYWTNGTLLNTSNVLFNQTNILNLSTIGSDGNYHVVLRKGITNFVAYFGNTSYSYSNGTWVANNSLYTTNFTSSGTWQAPVGITSVNVTLVGGGGGGQAGTYSPSRSGSGGSAGNFTKWNLVAVTPGSNYAISLGAGGGSGTIGSNTSFNVIYNTTGGAAGTGYLYTNGTNGTQNISTSYPTASNGGSSEWQDCVESWYTRAGKYGGYGYGAGGGGGAGADTFCDVYIGYGGTGASGVAQIGYYTRYQLSSSTTNTGHENRGVGVALNQSSVKDYVGEVKDVDVPSTGGIVSLITDTIFYQQYISNSGFGSFYCATLSTGGYALFPGTPIDVKASNSGTASISARGSYGNVYDAGAVARASLLTGNTIRSVDSAMASGLFAAFGGDAGIIYMFSKEGSAIWYTYYTGGIASPIKSVAVGWNGECVVVGRGDGRLEYYITNVSITPTPTPSYVDAQVRVYKDSAGYANQPVTVYSSAVYNPYVWTPTGTSYTDGGGVFTYTTTTGVYYKFVVNNVPGTTSGEGEVIWQSNTGSTVVQIFITSASTPYEWNAYYNTASNNVTTVYTDSITPTSVIVSIKDLKTNLVVLTRTYLATPNFVLEYHDQLGNGSYQVSIIINRLGASVRDQRMVMSPNTYGTILPNDQYITWAISTFVLMLIAGMFSYSNSKRGALAVVVVAVIMMIFKLLPWGLMTVAMLAAIFAVMSLFASRVQ